MYAIGRPVLLAFFTTLVALVSGPNEPAGPMMSVWTEELTVCEAPAPPTPPRALCVDADGVVDARCLADGDGGVPAPGPRRAKRSVEIFAIVPADDAQPRFDAVAPDAAATHPLLGHARRLLRPPRA